MNREGPLWVVDGEARNIRACSWALPPPGALLGEEESEAGLAGMGGLGVARLGAHSHLHIGLVRPDIGC